MAEPAPGGARLTIGVPKEILPGERRVALVPETVGRLVKKGLGVLVEHDAGAAAYFLDDAYTAAGAQIVPDAPTLYGQSDLVVKLHKPMERASGGRAGHELDLMRPGTGLIAFLAPLFNPELVELLAQRRITTFSMDAIPRTTRAQYMDALSSQSTVAGYKAVLLAADHLAKFFPLLMTAAGTIPPAKVLVIGAGVAGLQAIGTARRLGAVVEAYDVRAVVKEQIESLGAKFVSIDVGVGDAEAAGGYARELTPAQVERQQQGLAARCAQMDVVITTAQIPGRPAPRLVTEEAVRGMRPGSVIVDLAGETGGSCALTVPGETVVRHGVTIMGPLNIASELPYHASQMYSKNLQNLLDLMVTRDGRFTLNFDDDIIKATCITDDGEILHPGVRAKLGLPPLAEAAPPTPPMVAPPSEPAATPTGTALTGERPEAAPGPDGVMPVDGPGDLQQEADADEEPMEAGPPETTETLAWPPRNAPAEEPVRGEGADEPPWPPRTS